jgi:hypothetical protein
MFRKLDTPQTKAALAVSETLHNDSKISPMLRRETFIKALEKELENFKAKKDPTATAHFILWATDKKEELLTVFNSAITRSFIKFINDLPDDSVKQQTLIIIRDEAASYKRIKDDLVGIMTPTEAPATQKRPRDPAPISSPPAKVSKPNPPAIKPAPPASAPLTTSDKLDDLEGRMISVESGYLALIDMDTGGGLDGTQFAIQIGKAICQAQTASRDIGAEDVDGSLLAKVAEITHAMHVLQENVGDPVAKEKGSLLGDRVSIDTNFATQGKALKAHRTAIDALIGRVNTLESNPPPATGICNGNADALKIDIEACSKAGKHALDAQEKKCETEFTGVKKDIKTAQGEIKALDEQAIDFKTRIQVLEGKVQALETENEGLRQDNEDLKHDSEVLAADIGMMKPMLERLLRAAGQEEDADKLKEPNRAAPPAAAAATGTTGGDAGSGDDDEANEQMAALDAADVAK